MAEAERTYHVGLAILSLEGHFQAPLGDALRQAWEPGTSVKRYGRTWTLTNVHRSTPDLVTGEIGFLSEGTVQSLFFDHASGEFVTESVPGGVRVPFAIRLPDGMIAYQLRPGLVREASFTGALEALLSATPTEYVWSVRQAIEARTWEEWRAEVSVITAFNIRVDRPNPHYHGNDEVEHIVEGVRVEYLRLTGSALDDAGIDADADLFRQAVDHVLRDYGRAAIHGVDQDGEESTWVKVKGTIASVTARRRVKSIGPPEVPDDVLVGVLGSNVSVSGVADLHEVALTDDDGA
jgi:hypothetical protein